MKQETWAILDKDFERFPDAKAQGVPFEEIDAAAQELGMPLDPDYREFIHRYGGAMVGPYPVFGLRAAGFMSKYESSFVEITRRYRNDGWPHVDQWIVIANDHGGNPFGMDALGVIWCYDHEFGGLYRDAENFEEFLYKVCHLGEKG